VSATAGGQEEGTESTEAGASGGMVQSAARPDPRGKGAALPLVPAPPARWGHRVPRRSGWRSGLVDGHGGRGDTCRGGRFGL